MASPVESTPARRTALFVDYQNLFAILQQRLPRRRSPEDVIVSLVQHVQRYLDRADTRSTAIVTAYGDFSLYGSRANTIQQDLYMLGAELRFVPSDVQPNASEIQISVDTLETLHTRSDIDQYVYLTGDRVYLPLVNHLKKYGCQPLVVTFSPFSEQRPATEDFILDANQLLDDDLGAAPTSDVPVTTPRTSAPVVPLEDDLALHTLALIYQHFGQYDEIYLTPLLRKLSDLLDEEDDPKELVSLLEESGAAFLEKRQGTPYNYTVLILNQEHPDVQNTMDSFDTLVDDEDFDEEEYEEDPYEDYEDEFEEDDEDWDEEIVETTSARL